MANADLGIYDNATNIIGLSRNKGSSGTTLRNRVIARDGGKCMTCGSTENLQAGHIVPFKVNGLYGIALNVADYVRNETSGIMMPVYEVPTPQTQVRAMNELIALGFDRQVAAAIAMNISIDKVMFTAHNVRCMPAGTGTLYKYCAEYDWNNVETQCSSCNKSQHCYKPQDYAARIYRARNASPVYYQ